MPRRKLGPPPVQKNYEKNPSKASPGLFLDEHGGIWASSTGVAKLAGLHPSTASYRFRVADLPHAQGIALPHDRTATRYHYMNETNAEKIKVDWQLFLDWKKHQVFLQARESQR